MARVKQSTSYIYFLKPEAEGQYIIEAAQLNTEEGILKTPVVKINVVANPNGIRQNPGRSMEFEDPDVQTIIPKDSKKKKKVYKTLMRLKPFLILFALLLTTSLFAQFPSFVAEVETQQALVGSPFNIEFSLKNAEGTGFFRTGFWWTSGRRRTKQINADYGY
jgi:hypothetical protein